MIRKVMCIDDDHITLTLCELVIKKAEFADEVLMAKNGKEALNYFSGFFAKKDIADKSEAPQIIFLDLNMPVMNGWDFLEEYLMKYADRLPGVKVVIISSTVNPEDFSRANRYDVVIDFISKPLTVEGVEDLMQNEHLAHYFAA